MAALHKVLDVLSEKCKNMELRNKYFKLQRMVKHKVYRFLKFLSNYQFIIFHQELFQMVTISKNTSAEPI